MLQLKRTLVISAVAVSIAACSSDTQATNTPNEPAVSSPASSPISSPASTSASASGVTIPGVDNIGEVNFKTPASNSVSGFFDAVNGSTAQNHQVSRNAPVQVGGWAILADASRPPDAVLITYGDNNSLLTVAPITLQRPDVVKVLKNPAYSKSGWSASFNPATLPTGKTVLKAWAYNATSKEAIELGRTHEVSVN